MAAPASSALLSLLAFLGMTEPPADHYQGYVEAEYVLVAPQLGGTIQDLTVSKGQTVKAGEALFVLEHGAEDAALAKAEAEAERQAATLADLLKSKRQPELDVLVAQREQASASFQLAKIKVERDEKLFVAKTISQADLDSSRANFSQAKGRLEETEAALATGQLSTGRDDAIRAAEASAKAAQAARAEAQWQLDQKRVAAPTDAFVFDTLYRPGEHVGAGQPVVSLLPPTNIKVRFFVPEQSLRTIKAGLAVQITCTSCATPIPAHVTYISPKAEYTPPQLFNRDNRERLIYMIEAIPDAEPQQLHPGQPMDVLVPEPQTP